MVTRSVEIENLDLIVANMEFSDLSQVLQLEEAGWPPWLRADKEKMQKRIEDFPQGQFVIRNEKNEVVASLFTVRIFWTGSIDDLPTWDDAVGSRNNPNGNSVVLVSMNVRQDYRGKNIAGKLLAGSKELLAIDAIDSIIAPFRPSDYGNYKRIQILNGEYSDINKYVNLTNQNGLPFDGWLRSASRMGAKKLLVQEAAMQVAASSEELGKFMSNWNPDKWFHHEVLGIEYIECGETGHWEKITGEDRWVYKEPNIWSQLA